MGNLYVDGHGLGMTRMILQKLTGGSWLNSAKYDHNYKHRFRMEFRNYYSNWIPTGGSSFGNSPCGVLVLGAQLLMRISRGCDIHVADLRISIKLVGAVFDGWNQDSGIFLLMPGQVNGHPNFNDTIKPMTARWFDVAPFTWVRPDTAVSSVAVQLYTFHREIYHYPFAPWANMVASSS